MDDKLRQDFPIDWEEDHYVSRREFFKFVTLASGGLALGSVSIAALAARSQEHKNYPRILAARTSEMAPGSSISFNYPKEHNLCILIHRPSGGFVAYSQRCTHLSCPVRYQADQNRLFCPCHNGAFAVEDGRVLQGPPPHGLAHIELEVIGDEIYAVGVKHGERKA